MWKGSLTAGKLPHAGARVKRSVACGRAVAASDGLDGRELALRSLAGLGEEVGADRKAGLQLVAAEIARDVRQHRRQHDRRHPRDVRAAQAEVAAAVPAPEAVVEVVVVAERRMAEP